MHLKFVLFLSVCGLCSGFFLLKDKKKPLIFCGKICPLYCPKSSSKRHDHDASSLIYVDHKPYVAADSFQEHIHHNTQQWQPHPTSKSTIAPSTSTKPKHPVHSPHFIEEGSGEYVYHPLSGYFEDWKPKPTYKPTEAPPKTTESPRHFDHHQYIIEDEPDYEYNPPEIYKHWEPKPTKPTTTKPTTEKLHLDHPYFIEDWPEYEYEYRAPRFYDHPHPTPSTTTATHTTTEEPTYICGLCAEKCDHKT